MMESGRRCSRQRHGIVAVGAVQDGHGECRGRLSVYLSSACVVSEHAKAYNQPYRVKQIQGSM